MPTYEEINIALSKQVNYLELARLIELDLNNIAEQLITEPLDIIEFKVFFEFDEFDTRTKAQSLGEGSPVRETPVLLTFISGDYSSKRGPQFFSTIFNLEILGFEKDLENLRKIFESYAYMNQGRMDDDIGITTTRFVEFPVFTDMFDLHGLRRVQGFQRLFMSYIYSGQLSNQVSVKLDGEDLIVNEFSISRQRSAKSIVGNTGEATTLHTDQALGFGGVMFFDNSEPAKKILRSIKNKGEGLNNSFSLELVYPNITTSTGFSWELASPTSEYDLLIEDIDANHKILANLLGDANARPEGFIIKLKDVVNFVSTTNTNYDYSISSYDSTYDSYLMHQLDGDYPQAYTEILAGTWDETQIIRVETSPGAYAFYHALYNSDRYYKATENGLVPETDQYTVSVDSGNLTIEQGGYLTLDFNLVVFEV